MSRETAILRVQRGAAGEEPRTQEYTVDYAPGESVLDALRRVRATTDPSLAIRYACLSANACKECMVEVDGQVVYACTTKLEPREMTVAPLSNKLLIRDLVTDLIPEDER